MSKKELFFSAEGRFEDGRIQIFHIFKDEGGYVLDEQSISPSDKSIPGIIWEIGVQYEGNVEITSIKYPHLEEFIPYPKAA